jgi:hypothetical protein
VIGESHNNLTYLIRWDSLADREQKWAAFASDPEWTTARAASEADGPIVDTISSQLLAPTAFSKPI